VIRRHLIAGVIAVLVAGALLVIPALTATMSPSASAACPAVEVVFARGRMESAGVGILGNAFINALRSKTDKNLGVYAVRYPADNEIDVGANDMSAHIQSMMNNCPDTRLVLGGYSLGAVNNTNFTTNKVLQVFWGGMKYAVRPDVDLSVAYYHEEQNSFRSGAVNVGGVCTTSAFAACSGQLDAVSFVADYRFAKRFDAYAGIMWSQVSNGLANGFLQRSSIDPTVGLRFQF